MSDDLPARLRSVAEGDGDKPWWWDTEERGGPAAILREAADEIEHLMTAVEVNPALSQQPVIIVHMEDPPGSGLTACSGQAFSTTGGFMHVPRVPCIGCCRRDSIRGTHDEA